MLSFLFQSYSIAQIIEDGDEFVRQVLEEEQQYGFDNRYDQNSYSEEDARSKAQAQRQEQEERIAHERAEQVRVQRETEFEAELGRMNEEQRKAAKRQRKRDARIVKRILNAGNKKRYYQVLGIYNWDIHVGPFTLRKTDSNKIRQAYRNQSKMVHPDKNRDGRAQEAFYAVENAASILGDEEQRKVYDDEVRLARLQRLEEIMQVLNMVVDLIKTNVGRVIWLFRRILGPFATPILVLGCLLV
jgi:predicted  nucleic acid-binding Zn-ribbon protein